MDKRLRELERQALFDEDARERLRRQKSRICTHTDLKWLCTSAFKSHVYSMSQCVSCDKIITKMFNEKTREWDLA